jgi:hypothetical protein
MKSVNGNIKFILLLNSENMQCSLTDVTTADLTRSPGQTFSCIFQCKRMFRRLQVVCCGLCVKHTYEMKQYVQYISMLLHRSQ